MLFKDIDLLCGSLSLGGLLGTGGGGGASSSSRLTLSKLEVLEMRFETDDDFRRRRGFSWRLSTSSSDSAAASPVFDARLSSERCVSTDFRSDGSSAAASCAGVWDLGYETDRFVRDRAGECATASSKLSSGSVAGSSSSDSVPDESLLFSVSFCCGFSSCFSGFSCSGSAWAWVTGVVTASVCDMAPRAAGC